jgi:hypothetical protein
MPWRCSPISVSAGASTESTTHNTLAQSAELEFDSLQRKEILAMKKLLVRYVRYILALLANVGFGRNLN